MSRILQNKTAALQTWLRELSAGIVLYSSFVGHLLCTWGSEGLHALSSCVYTVKHLNTNSFKHGTSVKDTSIFLADRVICYHRILCLLCTIRCLTISVNIYDFSGKYVQEILH